MIHLKNTVWARALEVMAEGGLDRCRMISEHTTCTGYYSVLFFSLIGEVHFCDSSNPAHQRHTFRCSRAIYRSGLLNHT